MNKISEVWDFIIEYEIASEESLKLITNINGYSIESLNDVIYCQTGYHDMKQFLEAE